MKPDRYEMAATRTTPHLRILWVLCALLLSWEPSRSESGEGAGDVPKYDKELVPNLTDLLDKTPYDAETREPLSEKQVLEKHLGVYQYRDDVVSRMSFTLQKENQLSFEVIQVGPDGKLDPETGRKAKGTWVVQDDFLVLLVPEEDGVTEAAVLFPAFGGRLHLLEPPFAELRVYEPYFFGPPVNAVPRAPK